MVLINQSPGDWFCEHQLTLEKFVNGEKHFAAPDKWIKRQINHVFIVRGSLKKCTWGDQDRSFIFFSKTSLIFILLLKNWGFLLFLYEGFLKLALRKSLEQKEKHYTNVDDNRQPF